jgi:hypothetical protein
LFARHGKAQQYDRGAGVNAPVNAAAIAVAAFADENLAVRGLLDGHVAASDLMVGAPLEVCEVAIRSATTFGFRLA